MYVKRSFKGYVIIIDETILFLFKKPRTNGKDVNMKKGGYAIYYLIMCKNSVHIVNIVCEWRGYIHDNHVWKH